MFESAVGLALLAAMWPPAALIAAAYLGSARPRRTTLLYVAGGVLVTAVVGVVALAVLRAGGLSLPAHRTPRYGVRLGLGVLAVAASVVVARRRPAPGRAGGESGPARKPGRVARLVERPGPAAAFAAGVLVFFPSASFFAAVQVIATARAGLPATAGALILIVVIDVMLAWLPLLFFLLHPEATTRGLKALNGWLRAHGRTVAAGALLVVGLVLIADGLSGLV